MAEDKKRLFGEELGKALRRNVREWRIKKGYIKE